MKRFVSISILPCLLLLAACSTNHVVKESETLLLQPSAGLRTECTPPVLVPSRTNGDIINNSLNRQLAFDECNARHQCLLDWHTEAEKVAKAKGDAVPTPASCGKYLSK